MANPRAEFGPFVMDLEQRALFRNGQLVVLPPKVLDTLAVLVERRGHIVDKEEILRRVWPDTFVEESNISVNIAAIRKALGETVGAAQFIETIPRRGYRFRADMTLGNEKLHGSTRFPLPLRTRVIVIPAVSVAVILMLTFLVVRKLRQRSELPDIRSIAVLPLTNLSRDPGDEYFADGMTEELITQLSRIGSLKVISRTSAMRYKHSRKALPEIARELAVDSIVEGSVLHNADRVRVTAQLVYAPTDTHLWAQSFDRETKDVLAIQSEIASSIAMRVKVELTSQESTELNRRKPIDPKAYEAYLRGSFYWSKYTPQDWDQSRKYYERAIELDPNYAPPYAGLAELDFTLLGIDLLPHSKIQEVKTLSERALQLDPSLVEAHVTMGWLKLADWDYQGAEQEVQYALDLSPNNSGAVLLKSFIVVAKGGRATVEDLMRVEELDPGAPISLASIGELLTAIGQFDRAINICREALSLEQNFGYGHYCIGRALIGKREYVTACKEFETAIAVGGSLPYYSAALGTAYGFAGQQANARGIIRKFQSRRDKPQYFIAMIQASVGDKEAALQSLHHAYEAHEWQLAYNRLDHTFDGLRAEPGFRMIFEKVGP